MIYPQYTVQVPPMASVYGDKRVVLPASFTQSNRRVIGQSCEQGLMHPSSLYFRTFPKDWKEQYPDEASMLHERGLKVGMFALTLGISQRSGLYETLVAVYGTEIANGIMDFALYNNVSCSNAASTFGSMMKDSMLFSVMPHLDDWYSNLFCNRMSEQMNNVFRCKWLKACILNGLNDVYISIDGTNMDYAGNNPLARIGHSKSGTKGPIVACIWVVCANGPLRGLPLTYFVADGNEVDANSVKKVFAFLDQFDLNVRGVLADRGFCTADIFNYLIENEINYVIMMTENTSGYQLMVNEYADVLPLNMNYSIPNTSKFGLVGNGYLMKRCEHKSDMALIYDVQNASRHVDLFLVDLYDAVKKWNDALQAGRIPDLAEKYTSYVDIDLSTRKASIKLDVVESEIRRMGYHVLAISPGMTAEDANKIYSLRDASEKVFNQVKSSLGYSTIRGHSENSVLSRMFVAFAAAIIRVELMNACNDKGLIVKNVINDSLRIQFGCVGTHYAYETPIPDRLKGLFSVFGVGDTQLKSLQRFADVRYKAEEGESPPSEMRKFEVERKRGQRKRQVPLDDTDDYTRFIGGDLTNIGEKVPQLQENGNTCGENDAPIRKRGRKPKPKDPNLPKRGRGRPKGSLNRSTNERNQLIAEGKLTVPPPRPRGRPRKEKVVDPKNDWDLIRKKAQERNIELPSKRRPGRPSKVVTDIIAEILSEQ